MNTLSLTSARRRPRAAAALHRQEGDGGTIDSVWAAADQAAGQDRLLNMVGSRGRDGTAQRGQHRDEPERSAATPVVGMARCMTGPLRGGRVLIQVGGA